MIDWSLVKTADDKAAEALEQAAAQARIKRDQLLKASDFMVLPDSIHDTAEARAYRQALRDVPEQVGFPLEIIWPEVSD
jgi:hypothetical protein